MSALLVGPWDHISTLANATQRKRGGSDMYEYMHVCERLVVPHTYSSLSVIGIGCTMGASIGGRVNAAYNSRSPILGASGESCQRDVINVKQGKTNLSYLIPSRVGYYQMKSDH